MSDRYLVCRCQILLFLVDHCFQMILFLVDHCCHILMFLSYHCSITDPPAAPANLCVTDYNIDFVTVTWDSPPLDGGAPILRYVIEKRDAVLTTYMQAGKTGQDTCSFTVDGLFSGHSYIVRVAAENERGRGEFVEIGPVTARLPYGKSVDSDSGCWMGMWRIRFLYNAVI